MPEVTQIRAPLRTARYRQVRVTVTQGPDCGRSIDVAGREVRIGTEVENDFVLNDEAVSRVHC
ncbi:MAG: FHA domain-containing protein, partial [Solirubrobacteraceae bacterium]